MGERAEGLRGEHAHEDAPRGYTEQSGADPADEGDELPVHAGCPPGRNPRRGAGARDGASWARWVSSASRAAISPSPVSSYPERSLRALAPPETRGTMSDQSQHDRATASRTMRLGCTQGQSKDRC